MLRIDYKKGKTMKMIIDILTVPIYMEVLTRNRYKSLEFVEDIQWDEILDLEYPLRKIILNFSILIK